MGFDKKIIPGGGAGGADNLGDHTATQNLDMATFDIINVDDIPGFQKEFVTLVEPTGVPATDRANVETAVNDANTVGGGLVLLNEGTFDFGSTGLTFTAHSNVTISGIGDATIIQFNSVADSLLKFIGTIVEASVAVDNYNNKDTSIFTTTAGDAGDVEAGDMLIIEGTESSAAAIDAEYNVAAAAGNAGTGEIELKYRTLFDMTSATVRVYRGSSRILIQNLKLEETGGTSDALIFFNQSDYCDVKNVTFEGAGDATLGCIRLLNSTNINVKNCRMFEINNASGIEFSDCLQSRVSDCDMRGLNRSAGSNKAGIRVKGDSYDIIIENNRFADVVGIAGVHCDQVDNARIKIINNELLSIDGFGIQIESRDSEISENTIINSDSDAIRIEAGGDRMRITDNKIQGNVSRAIRIIAGGNDYLIANNHIFNPSDIGILAASISGVIEGNTLIDCGSDAIFLQNGDNITVSDNVIKNSSGRGIVLTDGITEVTVSQNALSGNSDEGIHLVGNASGPIERCIITNNIVTRASAVGDGITITGGIDNIVNQNMVRGFTGDAILIEDSADPHVSDTNMVRNNNVRGLTIADNSTGAANVIADNIT